MATDVSHEELKIAVFDSGVGGLSILEGVQNRWPSIHYVYCSDNANYPYGLKSASDVVTFATSVAMALVERYQPHILVIACNTMSTIALPAIREKLLIPVIGVVPAIKPAAQRSESKVIGLLATPATVKRPYTDQLIQDFASDCNVIRVGSSALVDIAEAKTRGLSPQLSVIAKEIAPFFDLAHAKESDARLDTIVIGCTHFSLLRDELEQSSAWPVAWLDATTAIVERTSTILSERQLLDQIPTLPTEKRLTAVFTKEHSSVKKLSSFLKKFGFHGEFEFLF